MDWVRKPQMRLRSLSVLLLVSVVVTFSAVAVQAQVNGAQDNDRVSISIFDTELKSVVQLLMRETKRNIIIADQDKMKNKVSVALTDMPFETVLRYVAEGAGCDVKKDENGVYIIGAKVNKVSSAPKTVTASNSEDNRLSRAIDNEVYVAARATKVDKIELLNTSPSDMMWILGLYKDKELPKIQKNKFKPGWFKTNQDGSTEAIYAPGEATPTLSDNPSNDNTANRNAAINDESAQSFGGSSRSSGSSRNSGGSSSRSGGFGGNSGGSNRTGGNTGGMTGGNTGGMSGSGGSNLIPEGIEFIMPYELDNSLIVRGDEEGIDELKALINKLDIAPKQIMIKAEFVEMTTTQAKALGINWQLERLSGSINTAFNTPGNITVGYANGNVMATLQTQLSNSNGKLVNAPLISTMNNVGASIEISTTIPYLTSSTVFNSSGNPSTVTVAEFMDITSELYVLPRINNADNSITVYLEPTISDSPGSVDAGSSGKIPIQTDQSLQTTRRVQNGETIVVGGIIRKSETNNVNQIPILGDLPIIGQLFRSTSKDVDDKELLIFLTPTIIPEKPVAGGGIGVTP